MLIQMIELIAQSGPPLHVYVISGSHLVQKYNTPFSMYELVLSPCIAG